MRFLRCIQREAVCVCPGPPHSLRSRLSRPQGAGEEWVRHLASEAARRYAQTSDPTEQIRLLHKYICLDCHIPSRVTPPCMKMAPSRVFKAVCLPVTFNHLAQRHYLLYLSKMIKGLGEWLYKDRLSKLHIYSSTEWQPRGRYCTVCWAQITEETLSCFRSNSISGISNLEEVF